MAKVPPFSDLITATTTSAIHLEMRDTYTPSDPQFLDWLAGKEIPEPAIPDWYELVRYHAARGVRFRRVRIISEPVTDFIRYEYAITSGLNIAAGEQMRWLPRRRASDLCVPGNDFWVLDDRLVRFGHFAGNGDFLDHELDERPSVIAMCKAAFEAAWERATPHAEYRPA